MHAGGVKDPLIVHYPAGIKDKGGVHGQYHHVSDIVPAILEFAGIEAPEVYKGVPQEPIHGVSFAYALQEPEAPTRRGTQLYEMVGTVPSTTRTGKL